jgi:thiamine transport system ATP-binding protein
MIDIRNGAYEREGFHLTMSFAIAKGAMVSIIGPSGAGKSTLLNVVAGFESLRSGSVCLNGQDASNDSPAARPVSFIFQDNNSFAHLTARENVALGIVPSLRLTTTQWQQVDEALNRVGLSSLAARKPGEMSGGERQRIALARVLVRQKPILLLDEPFAALGPALRKDMMHLLQELQAEHSLTILMVTHQPEDARALKGQVMFVDKGQVRAPIAVEAFFKNPDADIADYLGQ